MSLNWQSGIMEHHMQTLEADQKHKGLIALTGEKSTIIIHHGIDMTSNPMAVLSSRPLSKLYSSEIIAERSHLWKPLRLGSSAA